jgi:C4-dicarboxylate-binding protein DctP
MRTTSRTKAALGAAALAAALATAPLAEALAQTVIRYTHYQPGRADQPKHAAALAFQAYVEGASGGRLKVEIFPAGQLGNAQSVMEQLALGAVQMAVVHDGGMAGAFKPIQVVSMPFAFPDQSTAWRVFDGPYGQRMSEAMARQAGARILGIADNGVRHFTNSQRPITSPADMAGMKIRVQPSPIFVELVKALGASPSAIDWAELPAALAQGVVDGQENGVTNILAASLFQHQKHVSLTQHVYSIHAYLVSESFWQGLSPADRAIVQRGADIAKGIHRGMTTAQDMMARPILEEKGMTVTALTPAQLAEFARVAQPPVRAFLERDAGKEWVDGLFAALQAAE